MKTMKKLFAMALAIMLVMSLATTAFAAGSYTLTLNGAMEGHTYAAYQIFAGDLNDSTLSNIVWGSGVTADGQTTLGNAADKAKTITSTAQAEAFAAEVAKYLANEAGSVTIAAGETTGTITGLEAGYYLIKTSNVPAADAVYTYYIMKVVKDTSATIKADAPEVEKTVNDSDANIGDTVTYTLTATMPSNLQGYKTYNVVFHDTMSAGLTYVGNVKVTVAGADKTSDFTVSHDAAKNVLTVSCDDVLALGATASSKIIVTYDAKLNANAVIGTEGNSNSVKLEYSNNPYDDGTGNTDVTPDDVTKVYTWQIPVFKYTGTDTALAGAGFTLYTDEACTKAVTVTEADGKYIVDPASTTTEIITGGTGKFVIAGLEKGTYYLKETKVPAGYNKCDNVTVVIGENGALTQNGSATTEVAIQNNAGSVLPETGGIGTTMFYVFGAIMMVGAAVLLVTKKRMASAE